MAGPHDILKVFAQTKQKGPDCTEEEARKQSIHLIKRAEKEKSLYQFKRDIYFCCYRTKHTDIRTKEEKDAVLLVFTLKLPGPVTGSGASETVMTIIDMLENILTPIKDFKYARNLDGMQQNYAILYALKVISEEDLI